MFRLERFGCLIHSLSPGKVVSALLIGTVCLHMRNMDFIGRQDTQAVRNGRLISKEFTFVEPGFSVSPDTC
jgi:hypothetical protein